LIISQPFDSPLVERDRPVLIVPGRPPPKIVCPVAGIGQLGEPKLTGAGGRADHDAVRLHTSDASKIIFWLI
jgi:hypothetical protein